MKAIVIIYDGVIPQKGQIKQILDRSEFITGDASVSVFDQEKLASLLISSVKPPKLNGKDADQAVVLISGMCRDITNVSKLSVDIITYLNRSLHEASPELDAFVRACSIISQNYPVSVKTREKYKFNDVTKDVITKLYQAWNNGQDLKTTK